MKTLAIEKIEQELKRVKKPSIKNYPKSKEYSSMGFLPVNFPAKIVKNINNYNTQVLEFDNLIFIISHGSIDGNLDNAEIIKAISRTSFKPVFIHCCFPGFVAEKYPELNFVSTVKTITYDAHTDDFYAIGIPDVEKDLLTDEFEIEEVFNKNFLEAIR